MFKYTICRVLVKVYNLRNQGVVCSLKKVLFVSK